nr:hypothetical protein [Propionibacteriales bacterium]
VGGCDLQAGGTWLAVDPERRAVATVFTPGVPAPATGGQRTRGHLPLSALSAVSLESDVDLEAYASFALLMVDARRAQWHAWNGSRLRTEPVPAGTHTANIDGLDATAVSPRQARWLPTVSASAPVPFDPGGGPQGRWRGWLDLLSRGLEPERRDALLTRHTGGGRVHGTKSVALLALRKDDIRYDVSERPWDPTSYRAVPLAV